MKMMAKNHVTCSLCSLPYATTELGFLHLSVWRLYNEAYRLTPAVQFSSRKLEDSRIHQEDVVQGSSIADVLTLRVL
jgi:hypothetical protein